MQLKHPFSKLLKANFIVTFSLFTAVVLLVIGYPYLLNQWLWLAIAWSFWIISIGGTIYVQMQKPESSLSHIDPETKETVVDSYFDENPREMYAYEGFIVSVICVLSALGYIIIYNAPKLVSSGI